ncbi:MAG: UvrD-helicase domain-containing protein [Clostridia bacterium]|nr:UvrD-helicase domain-containing protein [Clostridia bacterium]
MARTWTPAQSAAMQYQKTSLLVSAAAGSGKTATLTQRIINQIVGDENCTLDRMLIVTFTRAAAAELRARIASALTEAIAKDPANRHLNHQLLLLPGAHIHTIDAFFGEPVRANFERLGLPAGFRMADDGEADGIACAVMEEVVEDFYHGCRDTENGVLGLARESAFLSFVETLVSSRDFSALVPTLTDLYQKLVTSEQGVARIFDCAQRIEAETEADFFDSLWGAQLRTYTVNSLLALEQKFLKAKAEIAADPVCGSSFAQMFDSDAARCGMIAHRLQNGGYKDAAEAFAAHPATKKPTVKKDQKTPLCEEFEAFRKKQNDKIKKLAENFTVDPEDIRAQFAATASICHTLAAIMTEYDKRYSEEKLRLGVCEFSDMPRFMLRLLQNPDGSLTDLALAYRDKFDWVYIDEYQDVNSLQDKIFAIIGGDHRFMVGDIKQSIYGFREADPSIFAGYRKRFATLSPENLENPPKTDEGCVLFMSENFRCDKSVIDFTNLVCSYVFEACPDTIGYRPDDDLIHKKQAPEGYRSPLVQLQITQPADADEDDAEDDEDEGDGIDTETVAAVNEIVRLLREERKADGTPILPSDIAILCRSKTPLDAFAEALTAAGVPVSRQTGGELYKSAQYRFWLSLLDIIDNPSQDIPLSYLLTEPQGAAAAPFSHEQLALIRKRAAHNLSLYEAIVQYAAESDTEILGSKCKAFCDWLEDKRTLAVQLGADALLTQLAQDEHLAAFAEQEAFLFLYENARQFTRKHWNGLYGFVRAQHRAASAKGAASEASCAGGGVSIMTVHHSKGLEFPVCFLVKCGKSFNRRDSRQTLIYDKDMGIGIKLSDGKGKRDTLLRRSMTLGKLHHSTEEEMRTLYVALTRARERLYLTATVKKPYKTLQRECAMGGSAEIMQASNYLSWVLSAMSANEQKAQDCSQVVLYDQGAVVPVSCSAAAKSTAEDRHSTPGADKYTALIHLAKAQSAHASLLYRIPSKAAASKLSPNMLDTDFCFTEGESAEQMQSREALERRLVQMHSEKPDFFALMAENTKPTPAERGTAAHLFLQYCDFARVAKHGIANELERLVKEKYVTSRVARIVNVHALQTFFDSAFFSLVMDAEKVMREVHFNNFVPLEEFTQNPQLVQLVEGKLLHVQGSIDLLLIGRDGSITLCDYKTDRPTPEERQNHALYRERMTRAHKDQLFHYAKAVKQLFGKEPDRAFVFSLTLGEAIALK